MDLKIVGELEGDRRSGDIGGGRRDICPPSALGRGERRASQLDGEKSLTLAEEKSAILVLRSVNFPPGCGLRRRRRG